MRHHIFVYHWSSLFLPTCLMWIKFIELLLVFYLDKFVLDGLHQKLQKRLKKVRISYTDSIINWMDQSKFKQEEAIINQTVTPQKMTLLSAAIDFLAHIKGIEYYKCRLEQSKFLKHNLANTYASARTIFVPLSITKIEKYQHYLCASL